jgi:hypothetical protein
LLQGRVRARRLHETLQLLPQSHEKIVQLHVQLTGIEGECVRISGKRRDKGIASKSA